MTITFNTKGYDGFIDFIKAYAILCVLFGHTFLWLDKVAYGVWAGMQVPLFILVQSFHFFKKKDVKVDISRIMKRVVIPFVVVELLIFAASIAIGASDVNSLVSYGIRWGGYGPGSYYPWIFVQVALLLPLCGVLLKRSNPLYALLVLLVVSELTEMLFSVMHLSDNIYRLLAVRYLLLFFFGWQWAKGNLKLNWATTVLAVISLIALGYFEHFSVDNEPWFYTTGFPFHRWPCYFWLTYGLIPLLYLAWNYIKSCKPIETAVKSIAGCSYEIFLIQMALIFLFKKEDLGFLTGTIQYIVWVAIIWTVSIWGGYHTKRLLNKLYA